LLTKVFFKRLGFSLLCFEVYALDNLLDASNDFIRQRWISPSVRWRQLISVRGDFANERRSDVLRQVKFTVEARCGA
jgi:hypothetical protein